MCHAGPRSEDLSVEARKISFVDPDGGEAGSRTAAAKPLMIGGTFPRHQGHEVILPPASTALSGPGA